MIDDSLANELEEWTKINQIVERGKKAFWRDYDVLNTKDFFRLYCKVKKEAISIELFSIRYVVDKDYPMPFIVVEFEIETKNEIERIYQYYKQIYLTNGETFDVHLLS